MCTVRDHLIQEGLIDLRKGSVRRKHDAQHIRILKHRSKPPSHLLLVLGFTAAFQLIACQLSQCSESNG